MQNKKKPSMNPDEVKRKTICFLKSLEEKGANSSEITAVLTAVLCCVLSEYTKDISDGIIRGIKANADLMREGTPTTPDDLADAREKVEKAVWGNENHDGK